MFFGGDSIFRTQKARILMAFFSTIFVVFISIMISQNLSAGNNEDPQASESSTPPPNQYENGLVPNGDSDVKEEDKFLLTNKQ